MRVLLLLCLVVPAFCDQLGSRVVGGSNTNIASHPHQLSLRASNSHSCGASLISGTKAVTAAHCGGGSVSSYSVLAGTSDRTSTTCGTCALRTLTSFVRHPSYSSGGGYPNDIATLRFANIPTNANTGYIGMPASNGPNYAGSSCVITGWGRTNIGTSGSLPVTLQAGTMTVMTNAACANVWGNSINNGHICVTSSTVSSCNGDSGGPLVCSGVLAGATSWGNATCNPNQPSIYSRITFFRAWIDAN
jgi:secreted trypsin-like serine protease